MTDFRRLIHAPAIEAGAIVKTPTGREARVLAVDTTRGEALVEWMPERAAFRCSRLVFLDAGKGEAPEGER